MKMIDIFTSLLDSVADATGIQPQPFQTQDYGGSLPAITYSFYPMTDNGAVATYRLLIRVHGKNLEQATEVLEEVRKELVTVGDVYKDSCQVEGNGGGSLIDSETGIPQLIEYFDLTTRS